MGGGSQQSSILESPCRVSALPARVPALPAPAQVRNFASAPRSPRPAPPAPRPARPAPATQPNFPTAAAAAAAAPENVLLMGLGRVADRKGGCGKGGCRLFFFFFWRVGGKTEIRGGGEIFFLKEF